MADDCNALGFKMDCGNAFNEYDEIFATDIGSWEMEITNTEGKAYKFRGSLCANFEVD